MTGYKDKWITLNKHWYHKTIFFPSRMRSRAETSHATPACPALMIILSITLVLCHSNWPVCTRCPGAVRELEVTATEKWQQKYMIYENSCTKDHSKARILYEQIYETKKYIILLLAFYTGAFSRAHPLCTHTHPLTTLCAGPTLLLPLVVTL